MVSTPITVIGGGVIQHVRNHLALCAPAYGSTARRISQLCEELVPDADVELILTRMASGPEGTSSRGPETFEDMESVVDKIRRDEGRRIVFFSCAIPNFDPQPVLIDGAYHDDVTFSNIPGEESKHGKRIPSDVKDLYLDLTVPLPKLLQRFRRGAGGRKDIFLVGFKTTCGESVDEQYVQGLRLLKSSGCNLVLANDVVTRVNMVVTPEEARYHMTTDRDEALRGLVEMSLLRSKLTFTRTQVIEGSKITWSEAPHVLRAVVEHCIKRGAYKPFMRVTVGHFAYKIDDVTFVSSMRGTSHNNVRKNGMVKVEVLPDGTVRSTHAKPSAGARSQRFIFDEHPDIDCIVHFHCPIRSNSHVPIVSQREFECGSDECGGNTSSGLKHISQGLKAVFLDEHGPNIAFDSGVVTAQDVISFIEVNFDLSGKTGGLLG